MSTSQRPLARLASHGLLSVGGSAISSLAGIALVAVVTNGFARDLAGTLFATTSAWLILTAVTQLGTEVGLVRWLPTLRATERTRELRSLVAMAMVPVGAVAVAVGLALFVLAEPTARLVVGEQDQQSGATMLRCLAVFVPVGALYHVVLAATRGLGTMRTTAVVDLTARSLAQPVCVLAVALTAPSALALVLAWVAPFGVAAVAASVALRRALRRQPGGRAGRRVGAEPVARRGLRRDFWAFTVPRAFATISQAALKRLDIILVAALRSPAEAAVYTAATRFVVLGQLGVQAIQQALSPQLSGLFAVGDRESARQVFQTATGWMMLVAWPVYLVCAAVAPLIMSLFGPGYGAGAPVVVILAVAMLFATACGSVDTVLLMAGRSWLSLANNLTALAVNVGLGLALIAPYGLRGAAIAWAVAIVVRNLLPLVQVRLAFGLHAGSAGSVWVGASALVCFGATGAAAWLIGLPYGWVLVVEATLGVGAYCAALWHRRADLHLPLLARTVTQGARRLSGRPEADAARPAAR